MCVYIYVCVHIYIHKYIYINKYIYTHTYTYIHTYQTICEFFLVTLRHSLKTAHMRCRCMRDCTSSTVRPRKPSCSRVCTCAA